MPTPIWNVRFAFSRQIRLEVLLVNVEERWRELFVGCIEVGVAACARTPGVENLLERLADLPVAPLGAFLQGWLAVEAFQHGIHAEILLAVADLFGKHVLVLDA